MEIDVKALKKGGFMKQSQKDYFSMRLRIAGGEVAAEQLLKLVEVSLKYGKGNIHLTARQGIEIPFIHISNIEEAKKAIASCGLSTGVCGPTVRTVTGCQGSYVCPSGKFDSRLLIKETDGKFYGAEVPCKFKIGISACTNNCLKTEENDFGIAGVVEPVWDSSVCTYCGICESICKEDAIKVHPDSLEFFHDKCTFCGDCIEACPTGAWREKRKGFRISVGGKMGRHPKLGTVIFRIVEDKDEVIRLIGKTVDFFREFGNPKERFSGTLERVGIDKLLSYLSDIYKEEHEQLYSYGSN